MSNEQTAQIAQTILEQLGGRRFLVMTGSHTLVSGANEQNESYLRMTLRRNKISATYLKITLTPADTYTVEFLRVRQMEYRNPLQPDRNARSVALKVLATYTDVYCDQLQEIFTRETGLYTHL